MASKLGEPGGAVYFNGSTGFVNIGSNNRSINTRVSMEVWVKTSSNVAKLFISKYNGSVGYYLQMNADGTALLRGRDGVGPKGSGNSTTPINDNQWHHVVGTVNLTTGKWRIYIDGVDESSTPNQGAGSSIASTSQFYIGANSLSGDVFEGTIDKAVIWNIELSPAVIASNIEGCLPVTTPGIVGYFDFDEGIGTTTIDNSSYVYI